LEFIYSQAAIDDFLTRVRLAVKVEVLFLLGVDVEVVFEISDSGAFASFSATIEANVGLGTLTSGIDAQAAIGDYLYDDGGTSESSLLAADWDLDVTFDWETAQWLKDLGALILQGLRVLADAIVFVWNAIVDFVEEAWETIKNIAAAIGGAIADFLDGVNEALEAAQDFINKGVEAVVALLDGANLGILGDIVEGLADIGNFVIDRFQDGLDIVAGIFTGDWSRVGEAAANLFGFSKVSSKKEVISTGTFDEIFGCPLLYQRESPVANMEKVRYVQWNSHVSTFLRRMGGVQTRILCQIQLQHEDKCSLSRAHVL